jgi:hypothetical protein
LPKHNPKTAATPLTSKKLKPSKDEPDDTKRTTTLRCVVLPHPLPTRFWRYVRFGEQKSKVERQN